MEFGPVRTVKDDLILSPFRPRAVIRFSSNFIYLGDLQYIARDTHQAEEFIFLNPNSLGHAQQLLLVHFESFLENKEGSYELIPQKTIQLDQEEYQYERYFLNIQEDFAHFPGSDLSHAADYIRQRAYTLAGDMSFQRFLRVLDPDKRYLFSITYMEECDDPHQTREIIDQDAAAAQALLERALAGFSILHP